jgi:hypothetical protein
MAAERMLRIRRVATLLLSLLVFPCALAVFPCAWSARSQSAESTPAAQTEHQPPSELNPRIAMPLRFDAEVIRLRVTGDSLEVDGSYYFLCQGGRAPHTTLFFPYPRDSLLGEAHMVALECRCPRAAWQPMRFEEVPRSTGARWWVPLDLGDSLEVRACYRQALLGCYARYIVTTTKAWRQPLKHARFEIYLPDSARPVNFSYPFERHTAEEQTFYLYEATDFMPEWDITVEWIP